MALEDEFPGEVKCSATRDAGISGNFEVTLKSTGAVLHSKKAGGGRCESDSERKALYAKIREAMGKN